MIILQANDGGNFMMSLMMFIRNNAMYFEEFKIYSTIDCIILMDIGIMVAIWFPWSN